MRTIHVLAVATAWLFPYLYLPLLPAHKISNMSKKPGSTVSKKFINNPDHVVQEMLEVCETSTLLCGGLGLSNL